MDISRTNRSYRILQAALNQIGNNAGSHSTLAKMRVEPRANVGGMTARNIKLKDTKGDISTPKTSKLFSKTARGKISGTVKGTVRRLLFDDDIDFRENVGPANKRLCRDGHFTQPLVNVSNFQSREDIDKRYFQPCEEACEETGEKVSRWLVANLINANSLNNDGFLPLEETDNSNFQLHVTELSSAWTAHTAPTDYNEQTNSATGTMLLSKTAKENRSEETAEGHSEEVSTNYVSTNYVNRFPQADTYHNQPTDSILPIYVTDQENQQTQNKAESVAGRCETVSTNDAANINSIVQAEVATTDHNQIIESTTVQSVADKENQLIQNKADFMEDLSEAVSANDAANINSIVLAEVATTDHNQPTESTTLQSVANQENQPTQTKADSVEGCCEIVSTNSAANINSIVQAEVATTDHNQITESTTVQSVADKENQPMQNIANYVEDCCEAVLTNDAANIDSIVQAEVAITNLSTSVLVYDTVMGEDDADMEALHCSQTCHDDHGADMFAFISSSFDMINAPEEHFVSENLESSYNAVLDWQPFVDMNTGYGHATEILTIDEPTHLQQDNVLLNLSANDRLELPSASHSKTLLCQDSTLTIANTGVPKNSESEMTAHFEVNNNTIDSAPLAGCTGTPITESAPLAESALHDESAPPIQLLDNTVNADALQQLVQHAVFRSRKKSSNPDNWTQNKRRSMRNCGKEYVTKKGKVVPAKFDKPLLAACCTKKCIEKLSVEDCLQLRKCFWNLGSFDAQNCFIAGAILQNPVKTRRIPVQATNGSDRHVLRERDPNHNPDSPVDHDFAGGIRHEGGNVSTSDVIHAAVVDVQPINSTVSTIGSVYAGTMEDQQINNISFSTSCNSHVGAVGDQLMNDSCRVTSRNRKVVVSRCIYKTCTRQYQVQVQGRPVTVCKKLFCEVFNISSGRVNRILSSQTKNYGVPAKDMRGKHSRHTKVPDEAVTAIESHIRLFPVLVSHYTRAHSANRKYLASDISLKQMYNLYRENCIANNIEPQKLWMYRKVFCNKFNLSFHTPRKDTCKKCDLFKVQHETEKNTERKQTLAIEHEVHLMKAEAARKALQKESTNDRENYDAFSFDLQKVLPLPKLTTNEAYYCRQLSVYNLGIHSLINGNGIMHIWDESIASRGSEEVGSCLFKYCQKKSDEGVRKVTAYSDACGGQNRNSKVVLMWMHITQCTNITEINHKFMASGHSFMPSDSDFGVIENATNKATELYVPEQWCDIILKCNRKHPFTVVQMNAEMFLSIRELQQNLTVRKVTEDGQTKIEWLKIQWIQIRKNEPCKMYFKYSIQNDLEFYCANFAKRGHAARWPATLKELYPQQPRPVSAEKLRDIKKLLKYVPPIHHHFYDRLQTNVAVPYTHVYDDELLELSEDEMGEEISEIDQSSITLDTIMDEASSSVSHKEIQETPLLAGLRSRFGESSSSGNRLVSSRKSMRTSQSKGAPRIQGSDSSSSGSSLVASRKSQHSKAKQATATKGKLSSKAGNASSSAGDMPLQTPVSSRRQLKRKQQNQPRT